MNRSASDLLTRISVTIREKELFQPGDTVIVAISGGADSTALLDILSRTPDFSLRLVACHLNHSLRGKKSDDDEEFCRVLASRHSIPFESRRVNVKEYSEQHRLNLEDAGRRLRITYFTELRDKWQASAVVLAHHADDQAETLLMRLLRGAGADGLGGMQYRNRLGFVRPLLGVSRSDIEAYLTEIGQIWREDASNLDTSFLRNRIRHELLPILESYNPRVRERLTCSSALLADESELLNQQAVVIAERSCSAELNAIRCDIGLLASEPLPLRRRVYRLLFKRLTGSLDHFSNRHIEELDKLIHCSKPNATVNMPRKVKATREYGLLILNLPASPAEPVTDEQFIVAPGSYELPCIGSLTLTIEPRPSEFEMSPLPVNEAVFDLEKAPFPWRIRTFRDGDRIVPFGMRGRKKVKDLFIDEKIPFSTRQISPLLFSGETLLWVCGVRSSDLVRVDSSTSILARVHFSRK